MKNAGVYGYGAHQVAVRQHLQGQSIQRTTIPSHSPSGGTGIQEKQ